MVHSVSAVGAIKKTTRDGGNSSGGYTGNGKSTHSFSKVLETELSEKQAPTECRTVTYGSDSKLRTFLYQTREYQY